MSDRLSLLMEAEKRGLLSPEKKAMLAEATKRGLVAAAPKDPVMEAINRSPTAGLVDTAASLASGAVAAPVAGLVGLAQGAKNLVSEGMPAGDRVRQVQDALTYEPRTEIGQGLTKAISYPFQKLADVADTAGGAAASGTKSPAVGAAVNTALQALPLVVGRVKPAAVPVKGASAMAQADAATVAAKEAGYVVPPTQANPSLLNQVVEGAAGKIKTGQKASERNQGVTNNLVRKALGVAEDAPLNADTLSQVRKAAGQSYERVRSAGVVTADPIYFQTLDQIAAPFERAAKDFPDAARTDVIDAVKAAKRESFDAGSAVDQIGILRDKADAAYRSGDKKLGGAYKGISAALEEQLARHLDRSGAPDDVIKDFRNARETIAKSYTVEKHLQPNGNVDAIGLGNELKKKPLTGELRTAAEFGKNFRKGAQLPEKVGGVPMSPWEHAMSIGSLVGGIVSGHPSIALAAALPYARPALQNMVLSDFYQRRFTNPPVVKPSILDRIQEFQSMPAVPVLEMSEAQRR